MTALEKKQKAVIAKLQSRINKALRKLCKSDACACCSETRRALAFKTSRKSNWRALSEEWMDDALSMSMGRR